MTDFDLDAGAPPAAAAWVAPLRPDFLQAIRRGLRGRCLRCGQGRLFTRYLKQADSCAACGEDYSAIRADDGPAWLTILIVGHVIVGLVLIVESHSHWPAWVGMSVFPLLAAALALFLLPRAKGAFIAAIWATKAAEAKSE